MSEVITKWRAEQVARDVARVAEWDHTPATQVVRNLGESFGLNWQVPENTFGDDPDLKVLFEASVTPKWETAPGKSTPWNLRIEIAFLDGLTPDKAKRIAEALLAATKVGYSST